MAQYSTRLFHYHSSQCAVWVDAKTRVKDKVVFVSCHCKYGEAEVSHTSSFRL